MSTTDQIENVELEEGTAAADTLAPASAPGETKAQMLDTFVQLMSQLGKEDLSKFLNDAIAQIGKEADPIADGSAKKNLATIAVKEDIDSIFGGEELTEEFKEKASTIFEAVVNTRVLLETTKLEEQFEEALDIMSEEFTAKLEEEKAENLKTISEALDSYLNYAAEAWLEQNSIEAENTVRREIAEDFMGGLQRLFTEHYITIPENRVDVFSEMKNEIESLKTKLNESISHNLELEESLNEAAKLAVISEASEGLVSTDAERLQTLAENVNFDSVESYRRKLEIIKESYVKRTSPVSTGLITEEIAGEDEDKKPSYTTPQMAAYVAAASKLNK